MKANWKSMSGFAAIACAFVLAAAVAALSQQGPGGGGPRHGGPGGPPPPGDGFRGGRGPRDGFGPFGRDLNLTDEQKAQIKKITDSFEESTKALHEQLRTLHESQPDPLKGGAFDEAAVRSAAQARANIQIELEVAHARSMSQIYNVLTAEQKAQVAAKRQEFEQRRKEREAQRRDDSNN